jgi:hypothetical protein
VSLRNEYTGGIDARKFDHVIVEYGTVPEHELFSALRPFSANDGLIDMDRFAMARPQLVPDRPGFVLYPIGDALASRNVHAALYDAIRLLKDL